MEAKEYEETHTLGPAITKQDATEDLVGLRIYYWN